MVGFGVYCEEDGLEHWKKATIYAKIFPSHGTDSDPNGDATRKRTGGEEKSHTHRLTDGMLDAPKGTGR
jgi:hypothetical protein